VNLSALIPSIIYVSESQDFLPPKSCPYLGTLHPGSPYIEINQEKRAKMNNNQFAFIYCVNDEAQFQDSWRHVSQLYVPPGFAIEQQAVRGAPTIANGYNQAMRRSQAKYKVYLHQDVQILNPIFIPEVHSIFTRNPSLGMLGVLGAKKLPANGVWWEAAQTYGKVMFFGQKLELKNPILGEFESVQGIDGMIMITQYDLPWREDISLNWHFYDASQSLEFIKAGNPVGVVRQTNPWCAHNSRTPFIPYQVSQQVFVNAYREFLG
jgi:hypothetical protein